MSPVELIGQDCILLNGKINFYNVVELTKKAEELFAYYPINTIDLHQAEECDSASLLLLLHLWRLALQQQRTLKFINLPIKVKRLIKLSDLENILNEGLSYG